VYPKEGAFNLVDGCSIRGHDDKRKKDVHRMIWYHHASDNGDGVLLWTCRY
jgi:hypothetical protein